MTVTDHRAPARPTQSTTKPTTGPTTGPTEPAGQSTAELVAWLDSAAPQSLAGIEEHLRDPAPEARAAALKALIRTRPQGTGDTLAWALADEDAAVRRTAVTGLTELPELYIGEDGVDALLLASVRGRDLAVREAAAHLLAALTEGAKGLYAQGLHDGEPYVRLQALLGLVALHAVADIAEAADDPDRRLRVAVAEGLARLGAEPAGLPALEQLLTDHDPVVRLAALDAAAELGLPEPLAGRVLTSLRYEHGHAAWQVRKRAAQALATAGPDIAVGPLLRALHDPIVDVRRAAVQALERWAARPEVAAALTGALADPDPGVRTQVRWALA